MGIYRVEKTRGLSLMEWKLLGCIELMAIMGTLKATLHDQCHVTPNMSYLVRSESVKRLHGN